LLPIPKLDLTLKSTLARRNPIKTMAMKKGMTIRWTNNRPPILNNEKNYCMERDKVSLILEMPKTREEIESLQTKMGSENSNKLMREMIMRHN
jgi:hypothetical protein